MPVQALVVDLFGTVVPKWPNDVSVERKRRMARAAGIQEQIFRAAWARSWLDRELGRASIDKCITQVLQEASLRAEPEALSCLRDLWIEPVREHLDAGARADARVTLQRAREVGLKVGLVSNAGPEVPGLVREGLLSDLFDAEVFSCTAGVAKPDPDIYLAVCRELAVATGDCVYVGDGGDQELQGAREVGMTPVFLRIEEEIAKEGLPAGAAAWDGEVITTFDQLSHQLGLF